MTAWAGSCRLDSSISAMSLLTITTTIEPAASATTRVMSQGLQQSFQLRTRSNSRSKRQTHPSSTRHSRCKQIIPQCFRTCKTCVLHWRRRSHSRYTASVLVFEPTSRARSVSWKANRRKSKPSCAKGAPLELLEQCEQPGECPQIRAYIKNKVEELKGQPAEERAEVDNAGAA
jgi:hypothetical protein